MGGPVEWFTCALSFRTVTPLYCFSIISNDVPDMPFPPVRTSVEKKSQTVPPVMNFFWPFTIKKRPSADLTADVTTLAKSDPPCGSVRVMHMPACTASL
jgi:hypothetical protein